MKKITIFTPTYNRAYCLPRIYESLLRQTNKDFHWLVIDDGSTDGTQSLVQGWEKEGLISMRYIFQSNKGMIGAHSTAHSLIDTELCMCLDSDDYMVDNAIERIIYLWDKHGYPGAAGLVGLEAYKDGTIVGSLLPESIKEERFSVLYAKCRKFGDKAIVHNTRVFQKYLPYPSFNDEKFRVTSYLYLLIEREHKLLAFNEVFIIAEYMSDGLTNNLFEQYRTSPKSFAFYRIAKMRASLTYWDKFRNAVHYVSSSFMAKDRNFLKNTPYKLTTILAIPLGVVLYFYITNTERKGLMEAKRA